MWESLQSKLGDAAKVARLAIFGCVGVITLMWLLNIIGLQAVNGLFGFVGLLLVVYLAISPKILVPSGAVAGLVALTSKQNPIRGSLQGPLWIVSIARSFLYGFLFFATFLTFWSFENSWFAFWGIFLVAMMLFIWRERYGNMGAWAKWIEWAYIMVCAVALLWGTFGDVYHGRAFDPETGAALYMVSPSTGEIDSLGRTPKECEESCFSESTGEKLEPMTKEQALRRNPSGMAHKAVSGISNLSLPDISLGGSAAGSDCPEDSPCLAYPGYVVTLTADEALTINQGSQGLWKTGLDIKLVDPELRAKVHDSRLFKVGQVPGTNILTLKPEPSGFKEIGRDTIEIVMYPRGTGDAEVAKEHGIAASGTIDLTPGN